MLFSTILWYAYHCGSVSYPLLQISLFIGVQDASGTYLVGAHLGGSANKPAAGTMINYYHRRGRRPGKDLIRILNPTNAVLLVVVSKKNKNYLALGKNENMAKVPTNTDSSASRKGLLCL